MAFTNASCCLNSNKNKRTSKSTSKYYFMKYKELIEL